MASYTEGAGVGSLLRAIYLATYAFLSYNGIYLNYVLLTCSGPDLIAWIIVRRKKRLLKAINSIILKPVFATKMKNVDISPSAVSGGKRMVMEA